MNAGFQALSIIVLVLWPGLVGRTIWDSIKIGMASVESGCSEETMAVRRGAKKFTKCLLEGAVEGSSSRLILDIQIVGSCKGFIEWKTACHFSGTDNGTAVH